MGKLKPIEKSFIVDGKYLYEMVGDAETKVLSYVMYDKFSGEIRLIDQVEKDGQVYVPPQNDLPFRGIILLPTYPREYGSLKGLLSSVRDFIDQYLELPRDYLLIVSYYVLLTWVFDCFEVIPYLRARGDYGTGKSRFLKVIGSICYRPCFAGGSSTVSPIFRLIDMYEGLTLVLDEADFRFSGPDAEIVKILNTGYMKGCPVLRTEGDKVKVPTAYNTYGPKILATRKEFSDLALESRCLTNYMTPMTRKDIPLHLPEQFYRQSLELRNQLLMFRLKNYGGYEVRDEQGLVGVEPRINQVLLPLFAIADDDMRSELVAFAKEHARRQVVSRGSTIEADVLYALRMLVNERKTGAVRIKDVAEKVNEGRSRENGDYLISPAKIGRINKTSFGFEVRRVNGVTEILWDEDLGESLCKRYGVAINDGEGDSDETREEVVDVEFVEDLFGVSASVTREVAPDKGGNSE